MSKHLRTQLSALAGAAALAVLGFAMVFSVPRRTLPGIIALAIVAHLVRSFFLDLGAALQQRCMRQHFKAILTYRFMQFTGSYRGNHFHRRMSREHKESYFYPR